MPDLDGKVVCADLFLASDAANFLTGVVLDVDGGLACPPI